MSFPFFIRPLSLLFFDQSSSTAAIAKDSRMAVMLSFYIVFFCYTCGVRDVMWVPACVGIANISPSPGCSDIHSPLSQPVLSSGSTGRDILGWKFGALARIYLWLAALTHVSWPPSVSKHAPAPCHSPCSCLCELLGDVMTGTWAYDTFTLSPGRETHRMLTIVTAARGPSVSPWA